MTAMRFRPERLEIVLRNEPECPDHQGTEELFDFLIGAPKDSPLRFAEVEPLHSRRYPRFRCRLETGTDPTWHLWFRVPDTKTVDGMREELGAVFAKNGWKVQ